ncbi:exopolysaccharide biosynthesis polyprenyl glycosylphosphotransferase [Hyphococcus sp.]|uniref:exopolysaccharide biosynthesis polyprenyl glycosylphosphotransferase n=1 Tax=Hyphococcus sp. TaxID=2038636 RepID=UPI003CCB976D
MYALYVFAVAFAALCAAATSRLLLTPVQKRIGDTALLRDAEPACADTRAAPAIVRPDGAVNTETFDGAEFEAAAALMNARQTAVLKRFFDILFSLALILFLAPLLALTAIAIKLDSAGPILYRQRRVGFGGKEFEVFKFRSMITDAEANGPQYAALKDARITRTGRIIRKYRIDEIPQAINVLRGEMSFVGPRPERPEFVRELEQEIPLYHCRHLIKPGITGWAQVKYEYAASVEGARTKLRYDLYYMRHFSPLLDIVIVLMTVRVALFGLGSR